MDTNNNSSDIQKTPNAKTIGIILAAVILVVLAVVLIVNSQKNKQENPNDPNTYQSGEVEPGTEVEPGLEPGLEGEELPEKVESTITTETGQIIPEGSHVDVPGANPIKDDVVVTSVGEVVQNDAEPMAPEAPQQTEALDKESLPESVIKLGVSAAGFSPSSFEVKAGAPVSLAVSSTDDFTHVFLFDDPSLSAVALGLGPQETRAITFNAPSQAGEYFFHCDVPGHAARGETGKMIVK
jgi:uncharacterized cupredoxin-like copper-binding protein